MSSVPSISGPAILSGGVRKKMTWDTKRNTAIAKLAYKLTNLPELCVLEFDVSFATEHSPAPVVPTQASATTGADLSPDSWPTTGQSTQSSSLAAVESAATVTSKSEAINSSPPIYARRLREAAVKDLLTHFGFYEKVGIQEDTVGFDFRSNRTRVIIPTPIGQDDNTTFKDKVNHAVIILPPWVTSNAKESRTMSSSPRLTQCTLAKDLDWTDPSQDRYREILEALIHSNSKTHQTFVCGDTLDGEFAVLFENDPVLSVMKSVVEPRLCYHERIRGSGLNLVLELEFELSAFAKKDQYLSDLVLNFFGPNVLREDVAQNFSHIKGLLTGLDVYCDYNSPNYYRPDEVGKISRIEGIQLPGEVSKFYAKALCSHEHQYSVIEYFNKVILKSRPLNGKTEILYPSLPLAKIGTTKAGHGIWIPLEHLKVYQPKVLPRLNIATAASKSKASQSIHGNGINQWIRKMYTNGQGYINAASHGGDTFRATMSHTIEFPKKLRVTRGSDSHTEPESVYREMKAVTRDSPLRFAVVYVTRHKVSKKAKTEVQHADQKCLNDIVTRIINVRSQLFVPMTDSGHHAIVSGGQELVDKEGKMLREILDHKSEIDIILSIVDAAGRSNTEVDAIYSALHGFAERSNGVGAPTVIVKKDYLFNLIQRRHLETGYFPMDILRKMNFMTNGINFETPTVQSKEDQPSPMMFIGAHVAHPSKDKSTRMPSIAAVVASVDNQAVHYPGSARIQTALCETKDKNGQTITVEKSTIDDLDAILKECMNRWKEDRAPRGIVFYRDGVTNGATGEVEYMAAKAAYKAKFGSTLPCFTYIRNPQDQDESDSDLSGTFKMKSNKITKTHYFHHFGPQQCCPSPEGITKILAKKPQMSQNVQLNLSTALPVQYAQKLSKRVSDYFNESNDLLLRGMSIVRDPMEHSKVMTNLMQDLLSITIEEDARSTYGSNGDSGATISDKYADSMATTVVANNIKLWLPELDDTMFYL